MTIVLATVRPTFAVIAADSRRARGRGTPEKFFAESFDDGERKVAAHSAAPLAIGVAGTPLRFGALGDELDLLLATLPIDPSVDQIGAAMARVAEGPCAIAVARVVGGRAELARIKVIPGQPLDVMAVRERLVFPPSADLREFYEGWSWDAGDDIATVTGSLKAAIEAGIQKELTLAEDPMKRMCGGPPRAVLVDLHGARLVE